MNLLLMVCHDLGRHLPCHGEANVAVPSLDRLARAGVRFDNYFCTAPQCSPSRGSIYTGRYPHTNGLWGLVNAGWDLPDRERHLAAILRDAGYRSALVGMQHEHHHPERLGYQEVVAARRADDVADATATWLAGHAGVGPFYLNVGIFEPHRPYDAAGYEPDDPDGVLVPPYLPDTAAVRGEVARLHGLVKALDRGVGRVLDALDRSGAADDTLVVFTTDHGIAMPRAKCTLYDPGIGTTLLIRSPGELQAGRACPELLSNIDLLPTVLGELGVPAPTNVQGRSFGALLHGRPHSPRPAVFAEKTHHGPPHPMRCVRTARHKYIRNWRTDLPMEIPLDVQWGFDPELLRTHFGGPLPPEELYDLAADPHEQRNLAREPAHAGTLRGLREMLDAELARSGDVVLHGEIPAAESPRRYTDAEYWRWSVDGGRSLTREEVARINSERQP